MKKEIRIFFTALMFYTRIPCPPWVDHSEEYIDKSTKYFPLIGWIVSAVSILFVAGLYSVFSAPVCIVLAVAAGILTTGAFHEDGFADVCDGFGGGWTKEKILEIMKDSRVGAYGVIGLVLILSLKIFLLVELLKFNVWYCCKAVILAHVLSRFMAVTFMYTHQYSRDDASSKVKPVAKKLSSSNFLVSFLWVIPALILFKSWIIILVIIPVYLMKVYLASYFKKWINGYTGDCLGATQQVTEIVTLLFCAGIWKYI